MKLQQLLLAYEFDEIMPIINDMFPGKISQASQDCIRHYDNLKAGCVKENNPL